MKNIQALTNMYYIYNIKNEFRICIQNMYNKNVFNHKRYTMLKSEIIQPKLTDDKSVF